MLEWEIPADTASFFGKDILEKVLQELQSIETSFIGYFFNSAIIN